MCFLFEINIKYKMYVCMYVFEEKCVCGRESVGFDSGYVFRKKYEFILVFNVIIFCFLFIFKKMVYKSI